MNIIGKTIKKIDGARIYFTDGTDGWVNVSTFPDGTIDELWVV